MKKIISLTLVLVMVLTFAGCGEQVPNKLTLPFKANDIQDIVVYKKTSEPNSSERIGIEDVDNIKLIYEHLDGTPIDEAKHEIEVPQNTVYEFIFRLSNHTKFVITYYSEAVKKGLISVNDEGTYFTASDIGWIWSNIEKSTGTDKE